MRNISTLTINMHLAGNYKYTQLAVLLLERAAQGGGQPLPDVIFIQEAFYNEGTLAHPYPVFRQLLGQLYPYQAHGPFGEGLHWFGSGLLILSRLPFVNTGDMVYDACANGTWHPFEDPPWDCFSRKGVAAAIINFGPRCGNVAFFNTHTNSTYEPGERDTQLARFRQMTEYWHFVHVMTGWDDGAPVIAGGDFNLFEYEINVFDYLSYTLLTAGFPGSLNPLGFTESEPWCAAHPSQCVGFSPHHRWLPLSTTGYNGGLEKNFTRDNPGRGIRITPIQFLKYPPTSWGGISDHVVLESVYRLSCGE